MSLSLSGLAAAVRLALAGTFVTLAVGTQAPVRAADAPPIAAAASLRYALDEIAKRFEKETGKSVKITYGATGNLVHQIEDAAPFQALFAADDESVKKLAKGGFTEGEPVVFARGQLSLVVPKGSPVTVDADLKGLKDALAAGKVKHCLHRQSGGGALWPRRAGDLAEGWPVGSRAAAARHRRERRPGGNFRFDRRRRGRPHRAVAGHFR